jgi:hypothetical protein
MKILLAVVTCGDPKFKARADEQRATWVPRIQGADVRFFLAKQSREPLPDEVFLDIPDDYKSLPAKVKAMFQWALSNGYTKCAKMDDDTLIIPSRFMGIILSETRPYFGFLNATPPKPWASGFCYIIDANAMSIVTGAPVPPEEWAEDRWVGGVLFDHGIRPHYDQRFALIIPHWRLPNFKTVAAICDCTGDNAHPDASIPKTMAELQAMCQ